MKFVKALFFIIASIIMGVCLIVIPEVSGSVSITYTTVLSIYLGLDVASMISKTMTLKKGDFEKMNTYKYVISGICLISLVIISLFVKNRADVSTALTSFISASMILIACIIGGLEGNKIATNSGKSV